MDEPALASLLTEHRVTKSLADVRSILSGVASAATAEGDDRWLGLIAEAPAPVVADALRAERERLVPKPLTMDTKARLAALREELKRRGLDGFFVPRADEHQGEYVARRGQRLAWLTGFTGSAGLAIVLLESAAIFIDGRYTTQVRDQIDLSLITPRHVTDEPPAGWLAERLSKGAKLGIDPWLHTAEQIDRLRAAVTAAGGELVILETNPLDAVWSDQPPAPLGPVAPQPVEKAGKTAEEKRQTIAAILAEKKLDATVITAPDSIAWLLNIRGTDVPHTPLPLSFAILDSEARVDLFIDARKLLPETRVGLGNHVTVRPPEELTAALTALGKRKARVLVDPAMAAAAIGLGVTAGGGVVVAESDPIQLAKATKNTVEASGARAAHRRDAVAMVRFLAWLDERAPRGGLTEIEASDQLAAYRREVPLYRDLSFGSISAAGANAAMSHYQALPEKQSIIEPNSLYLIDSGGQYLDGTTDITRTIAVGSVDDQRRERYTRVLKGHIAIATARFPAGTTGSMLDSFARRPLWDAGLDFDHGTGHGVGSFLSVHEGPHRISKVPNPVALLPGMIVSNEPGYYQPGGYGIRIENLEIVVDLDIAGAERKMRGFEALTMVPIDRRPLVRALLTEAEVAWFNAYHAKVRAAVLPALGPWPEVAAWLITNTEPLS